MPAKKPYRKTDRWANEKELAVGIGSGLNDVIGRGTLAGLLGAPGDIAGMAENGIRALIGLPQVQPWGGSEHIGSGLEKAGLVSNRRYPKTELLASLISPAQLATASLKAPTYARNALKLLDNLESAPTMARMGQRGAIDVWHGSPHKFDTFKAMDNIGGGEGAQAYGHGGYHASNKDVAQGYKDKLSGGIFNSSIYLDGVKYEPKSDIEKRALAIIGRDGIGSYKQVYSASKRDGIHTDGELAEMKRVLDFAKGKEVKSAVEDGALYRNQLRWPDPAREAADPLSDKHFLDFDKHLAEQSPEVRAILSKMSPSISEASSTRPISMDDGDYWKYAGETYDSASDALSDWTPKRLVHDSYVGKNPQEAAVKMRELGIPGIRYLDGGSRSAGQGSHNYVTFDDALVNILERNGQPVTAPQPGLLGKMIAPQDEALRVAQQNAAKPVSEGGLGLRPDNTPEERAAAMGFDTPAFHGSPYSFDSFSLNPRGNDTLGVHVGTAEQANDIVKNTGIAQRKLGDWKNDANVMPLMVRSGNTVEFPDLGQENSWDINGLRYQLHDNNIPFVGDIFNPTYADIRASIQGAGYDGVKYVNDFEGAGNGVKQESMMVFAPRNIRSRFAAFDPAKRDSADLLAGLSPLFFARPQEKEKKK